jgi:hypothetical protein
VTCLIVANQTLGGPELMAEVTHRISEGRDRFHVLVPVTKPGLEASSHLSWRPTIAVPDAGAREDARAEARRHAEHRLERMLELVREQGGEVTGEVGSTDALNSVRLAFLRDDYDEVIVSTLPSGMSRWLKVDLPTRVAGITDLPVTTVESET